MHTIVTLRSITASFALLFLGMPCLVAEEPQTKDLVAELSAQKQRNAEEAGALQVKLDAVYEELQRSREQRQQAMNAVLATALVSGGIVALSLFLFYRNKLKSTSELKAMNERLDRQWKDICKANEELTRANKELAEALAKLSTK